MKVIFIPLYHKNRESAIIFRCALREQDAQDGKAWLDFPAENGILYKMIMVYHKITVRTPEE